MSTRMETVLLTITDGVADVQLGDADGSSRMTASTVSELLEVVERIAGDTSVRAVLLRPRGQDFSAGGDIAMFESMLDQGLAQSLQGLIDDFHVALASLVSLDVPIVAAVRGAAVGAGLGLACIADVVVVAEDATLAAGGSAIGLAADGGATWYLPRLVGLRRAQEMLFLNRRLDGREAVDWGIATSVESPETVDEKALGIAQRLASGPTSAYAHFRALLIAAYETPLAVQLAHEGMAMTASAATDDAADAIRSFIRRERPIFNGR